MIVEFGNEGILIFDAEGRVEFANPMASEITGYSNGQLLEIPVHSLFVEAHRSLFTNVSMGSQGRPERIDTEVQLLTSTGDVKEVEVSIAALGPYGESTRYLSIRDMAARRKLERHLKDSEEKLRNLFERVRHGVFISSKDGKFVNCNHSFLKMLGYSIKEEFLPIETRLVYVNPEDRRTFRETIERDGFVKDMEVELNKKDGERITALLTGHPIKNEKGEIVGYEGICLDISERKRIENELREANEFFMNLIESSVDGIIAADMKGNIFIFNRGAEILTGHRAEEVIRKIHITMIYPQGVAKEVMRKLRSPDHGGVGKLAPLQLNVLSKAGEEIPIHLSAALIYDGAGKEVASVGIFTDLRLRLKMEKKLEETYLQLVSSEKMASLGKLAAGIAHEINNPLGGILIYASLMMEDLPEGDPKRQDLARIVQETTRCKDIVKSLLEFARQTEPKMEPTDVNRAVTDGLFFLENQALFHNIRIVKRLDPSLPLARGNAGQLKQVFMNITVNAAEAMHGGGTLAIATHAEPEGKWVLVEFSDTGVGIPDENLTRIFDPFFTTKDIGKGTGLGLSTSYGIIESHGGRINVKSRVGEGTTFIIELPIHPENNPGLHPAVTTTQRR